MTMSSNRRNIYQSLIATVVIILVSTTANIQMALGLSSSSSSSSTATAIASVVPFPHQKIALITGSNKGIGLEIARKLLQSQTRTNTDGNDNKNGAFICILGCRNEELGRAAVEQLKSETETEGNNKSDNNIDFVKIDLQDIDSIQMAAKNIEEKYGRCDVLINNAAVCFNDPTLYGTVPNTPFDKQAEITVSTNFFGTLALTKAMLPLLQKATAVSSLPSRIINITSSAGRLSILPSQERRAAFSSNTLTMEALEGYMKEFVNDAKCGTHREKGWPNTGYGVSKVGIIAMSQILARQYKYNNNNNCSPIMVNSVDPGYCATDQNNHQGYIPAEQGAETPYLLATIVQGESKQELLTGRHWYQQQQIKW
mmetsp:Transcript_63980/g.72384  ORF Transcript_63980/g.72384 Transcript_63980/m.72384 type:complete len:369 (+) Transcript_63980:3-1109(+)